MLLQQKWGAEIDSHDTVVRVNFAATAPQEYTGALGDGRGEIIIFSLFFK